MKKIIEFFKHDFEGEYQQYFFVIEADAEESFVKEVIEYLNMVHAKTSPYPWSDCLSAFCEHKQVEVVFKGFDGYQHLNEYYYIHEVQDASGAFTFYLEKNELVNHRTEVA